MKLFGLLLAISYGSGVLAIAATLTVTTTNQSGAGSLRQAILDANASPGVDVIAFAIPGAGPHIITPGTALPDVTQPLTVDGFTQPGASANTLADSNNAVLQIRIDGAGAFGASGLRLRASGCQVRGLSITRFAGEGVQINGATNCIVAGNFIGLEPNGTARANNGSGVQVFDSSSNLIGGTAPSDRNVLSGNFTAGIHLIGVGASNNVVEGNFIGTSPDGASARANFVNGVYVQDAPRNRIGGTTAEARNVISGNTPAGIDVSGFESVDNIIIGNFIGPDAAGVARLGSQAGVHLESGRTNRVGGSAAGEGNVISGNQGVGVRIGTDAVGNLVLGNRIGVDLAGGALSNGAAGIFIRGSGNRLGGAAPGEGNEIANNAPGIEVELGTGNAIRGNSIHDNRPRFAGFGGLGIDLAPFGVTTNDASDGDGGVNSLQNFPLMTAATASAASTRVQGTLNSRPTTTFALDFFSSPDCDPSGHGEGLKYLGSTSVTTDGGGLASFDVTLPVAAEGRQITATATDADGNTSEFSPCFAASVVQPPQTFFVTNTHDSGPGSLRQALLDAQASPASANNVVAFNIALAAARGAKGTLSGPIIIGLATPLAPIFEGVTIDGFTQQGASENTLLDGNNAVWGIQLNGLQLGPGANGLTINAAGVKVRGLEVSGFSGGGIHFANGGDSGFVEGCHLLNNQSDGLCVDNASGVSIGGIAPASRNVIHRNGAGIRISGASATDNLVLGNWIGPDPSGASGFGNFGPGIFISDSASGNIIGGTAPGAGNRIAFNGAGVTVFSGTGNNIIGNSMDNGGVGISLFPGANGDIDAPTITSATILANGGVQCTVTFSGLAGTPYLLHTYSSLKANANGEFFQGEATATTDGAGNANAIITTDGNFIGRTLYVTVTGPDEGTSPFSIATTPGSLRLPRSFPVTTTADSGIGSLRQAIINANNFLANGNNVISFNISGGGVHTIQLLEVLPEVLNPTTFDASTQPGSQLNTETDGGYNGVVLIELNGAKQGGGTAFNFARGGNIVNAFSLTGFDTALLLGGAGGNVIRNNLIGVNPLLQPTGNTGDGMEITSPNNIVERNVIGANDNGIVVLTTPAGNNEFHGNLFGFIRKPTPTANQFLNLANREDAIRFRFGASDNRVGGPLPQQRNLFFFNGGRALNAESGQRTNFFNNVFFAQPVPTTAVDFIAVAPGANDNILPPTLEYAYSDSDTLNLRVGFRYTDAGKPNTAYEAEFYLGEKVTGAAFDIRKFTPFHRFNFTTDPLGQASREEIVALFDGPLQKLFGTVRDTAGNSSKASDFVKVITPDSADLQTQLFAPLSAIVGDDFTMTVVVSNGGPATATNATLRQILSPDVELISFSGALPPTINGSVLDFPLGNIAAGESRTITLVVRGTKLGQRIPSARGQHQGKDPDPLNDFETRYVQIVPAPATPQADIAVKSEVLENAGVAGDIVTLKFQVSNLGGSDASNVRAGIDLPPGSVVESATASSTMQCQETGGDVFCTMDTLFAGGTVEITVRARLTGAFGGLQAVGIKADSNTADTNLNNNESLVDVRSSTGLVVNADDASVSWPSALTQMELQSTTSLTPVNWTPVPPERIVTADGKNTFALNPQAPGSPPAQFCRLAEKPRTETEAEYNQLSMELDGVKLTFTDWIQLNLKLPLADVVRYVNASFNGNWVIQNIPILSGLSSTVADVVSLCFSSGTYGEPVFTANTGLSVTMQPLGAPPPSTNETPIGIEKNTLGSGLQGMPLTYLPAGLLVGGTNVSGIAQAQPGFPNREQRLRECAPAAIVNSLEYLDANFGLQLPEEDIRLSVIKDAIGWNPAIGVPPGDDLYFPDWVQGKIQHMTDRNLGIVTELTTSAFNVIGELRRTNDVEIVMNGHMACVVGIAELLDDGRYVLTLSHDVNQSDGLGGGDGGTILQVVIFDPSTGEITGTPWGYEFIQFVIERPDQ